MVPEDDSYDLVRAIPTPRRISFSADLLGQISLMRYRVANLARSKAENTSSMLDIRTRECQYQESSYTSSLIRTMRVADTGTESRAKFKESERIQYSHRPKCLCDCLTSDIHAWVVFLSKPPMRVILHSGESFCGCIFLSSLAMIHSRHTPKKNIKYIQLNKCSRVTWYSRLARFQYAIRLAEFVKPLFHRQIYQMSVISMLGKDICDDAHIRSRSIDAI